MNKELDNTDKIEEKEQMTYYAEILDKMLQIEKERKKHNPIKITICVAGGICAIMFSGIMCFSIIKNNLSMESMISTLLAFFSIFISIFFYFKADETSANFYKSSYDFMKDISVTLGKIEERFGEKLNNLNEKITHLDTISSERTAEIEDQKENKDKIINELLNKANLNEDEKTKYKEEIEEKDRKIERLQSERNNAEREAMRLRMRAYENHLDDNWVPDREDLFKLFNNDIEEFSMKKYKRLREMGLIDLYGKINKKEVWTRIQNGA